MYDAASRLLRQVNGVARAREGDFRPVGLTGHFSDETGQQHHVALADSAEVRGRAFHAVIATSGEQPPAPPPPPPPGPDYIQLAQVHPDVAEALEILGKPDAPPNFGDLYKVLEIVSKNVTGLPGLKGLPNLKKMGWVPPAQLEAFTASANHQGISGDQARHARMEGTPRPEKMMTLSEARQVIGALSHGLAGLAALILEPLRQRSKRPRRSFPGSSCHGVITLQKVSCSIAGV